MSEGRPHPYRYHYPIEKLYGAMDSLVGSEDIRIRMRNAAINLVILKPDDFPPECQDEWVSILQALTWLPPEEEGQGTIEATTKTMDEEEAVNLARRIVSLSYRLAVLENM